MSVSCVAPGERREQGCGPAGPAWEAAAAARAAIGELRQMVGDGTVASMDLAGLAEQCHALSAQAAALHTAIVGQVDAAGVFDADEYLTVGSWLRESHRLDGSEASALRRTAAWLRENRIVSEAFAAGDISVGHVTAIRRTIAARSHRAQMFSHFEAPIVEFARNADVAATVRLLRVWCDQVDPDGTDADARDAHTRRRFSLSQTSGGWHMSGQLPDDTGAELAGILNEIIDRNYRTGSEDYRGEPATARRADALVDMARAAARSDLSQAARDRAKIVVLVPEQRLAQLQPTLDQRPQPMSCHLLGPDSRLGQDSSTRSAPGVDPVATRLPNGVDPTIPPELLAPTWRTGIGPGEGLLGSNDLRRLSCDAAIRRVVLDADSVPLDVGRGTRLIPPGLRTAVVVRDGGCVIPGCGKPPGWCEAHHIEHWVDGGETSLANLALMCGQHHRALHNGLWRITMSHGGRPVAHPMRR